MENFDDFVDKKYAKARNLSYSSSDIWIFNIKFLLTIVKIFAKLFVEIFLSAIKIFNPDKPKSIAGQIALVTGLLIFEICLKMFPPNFIAQVVPTDWVEQSPSALLENSATS
jgi:hypothetical protein